MSVASAPITVRGDARADSDLDLLVMSGEAFEQQKAETNTLAWRAVQEGQVHEFTA